MLVVATAGEAGLADDAGGLGARRARELAASAAAIGVARVEVLGYPDRLGVARDRTFATHPAATAGWPTILREEQRRRPDDLRPHRRLRAPRPRPGAPGRAPRPPRWPAPRSSSRRPSTGPLIAAGVRGAPSACPGRCRRSRRSTDVYTARAELTHRVDVRRQLPAKLASMRAHASQTGGGRGPARSRCCCACRARWPARCSAGSGSARSGRVPGRRLEDDIFASLRARR